MAPAAEQCDVVDAPVRLPGLLRRQQLLRLTDAGWARVLGAPWDAGARSCLGVWAARGLPLVVTRQRPCQDAAIAVGLPAPARYGRRRIALGIAAREVMFFDEFPAADAATRLLPRTDGARWRVLVAALAGTGCAPRVYGGYGWQALTRLAYVHADSDLDLLLPVSSLEHADVVAHVLARSSWARPPLDGELLFADGAAVAWREWLAHRQGCSAQVLVKRLRGVALETPDALSA